MTAPAQIPFDLGYRAAMGAVDFLVAPCNSDAIAMLDRWPGWSAPALVIHGPAGCGKTHLTHVWRAQSNAVEIARDRLTPDSVPELLGDAACVVVEDVDRGVNETALFHLYNLIAERRGNLLLTSQLAPARLDIGLPDLASRLGAAMPVEVGAPDDEVIGAVLIKHFTDRQLRVEPAVVTFLLSRMERSFAAARDVVAALDAAALAEKRRITVPLARAVLEQMEQPE